MKMRGIIFRDWEVRAILDGRKTMFRRAIKSQPFYHKAKGLVSAGWGWDIGKKCKLQAWSKDDIGEQIAKYAPYTVGDRLYVKETWAHDAPSLEECRAACEDLLSGMNCGPYYRATEVAPETLKWRSPATMPRWASRLKFEIVNVRVERVQDITEKDAIAEGSQTPLDQLPKKLRNAVLTERCMFARFWEFIHGPGAWDRNDWVWAVTFKRLEGGAA